MKILENRWAWLTASVLALLIGSFLLVSSLNTSSAVGGRQIKAPAAPVVKAQPTTQPLRSTTPTAGATKTIAPTQTPTPTATATPNAMSGTCRDYSGTELRVGQQNSVGLICLPGNKLFSNDGKVRDGLPSPTPTNGKK